MSDMSALFFLVAGLMCFAMVPIAEAKFRPIATATGVWYVVFSVLSYLDFRSRGR